jgi:hypothetical protein
MAIRPALVCGALLGLLAAIGCDNSKSVDPKIPANAPKVQPQTPAGAPVPGGKGPAAQGAPKPE